MPTLALPDVEAAVKAWAKTLALPGVAGRIFFGHPKNPKYPLVEIARIGGLPDRYAPVDVARISWSVWASDKQTAIEVARVLAGALADVGAWSYGSGADTCTIDGAEIVLGPLWRPDEEAHLARYIIDSTVTVRPTPA